MSTDDDEHTPPRGGAKRNTTYSQYDDRALLERMADKATQAYTIARRVETKVDAALAGRHPWYERMAPAMIAIVLFVWMVLWTTRVSSASVPEPSLRTQASR